MTTYSVLPGAVLIAVIAIVALARAGDAQEPQAADAAPQYAPEQIEQMLAPVALYPDSLLSDILMAAAYPLEAVEADRWLQDPGNAALRGDDLVTALMQAPWDPSVKALVPFPQILRMMDDNLDWTERLGNAFLASQATVMDAVQRLRQRASAAGTFQSTPEEVIAWDGPDMTIGPASPDAVYVPDYNPLTAYGDWPYPAFSPYIFPIDYGGAVVAIVPALWSWNHWNWQRHRIDIDERRRNRIEHHPIAGGVWVYDPHHRRGVPTTSSAPGGPAPAPPAPLEATSRASIGAPPIRSRTVETAVPDAAAPPAPAVVTQLPIPQRFIANPGAPPPQPFVPPAATSLSTNSTTPTRQQSPGAGRRAAPAPRQSAPANGAVAPAQR